MDIIEPTLYTGNITMQGTISETWCTFPNDLLQKLSNEQKKEMFQKIQKVIDEYAKA